MIQYTCMKKLTLKISILVSVLAMSTPFAYAVPYEDARRLLGNSAVERDLNLSGQQQNDSQVIAYLKSRDCHKERPYSIDGMNAEFRRRLAKMMQEADGRGKKLYIMSGKRSESDQARLRSAGVKKYGANVGKWIGSVKGSKHVKGIAADLKIGGCGGKNPERGGIVHQLARQNKLHFRLPHEPWHVEPIEGENIQKDLTQPLSISPLGGTQSVEESSMIPPQYSQYTYSAPDAEYRRPQVIFYPEPLFSDGYYYNSQTGRRYTGFVPIVFYKFTP